MTNCALIVMLAIGSVIQSSASEKIEISGNRLFTDKEILRSAEFNAGNDSVIASVLSLYRKSGYFSASARWMEEDGKAQVLRIDEGAPSVIRNGSIDIFPDTLASFDDLLDDLTGAVASEDILDNFAQAVVSRLADRGMPFARAEWSSFQIGDDGSLDVTLKVIPGPFCRISDFIFDGISRTRPSTIVRTLDLRTGGIYSEAQVRRSETLIDGMRFLDVVSPFEIEMNRSSDSCSIVYHLKELPSSHFDGAGGYVGVGKKSEFIGRAELEFGDLLGTGRSFGINWNRKDRYSGELGVNYREPFLLGSRFDLTLEVRQVDRDSSYIESSAGARFGYPLGTATSAGVKFGIRRVEPESGTNLTSSTSRSVKLEFTHDGTDYPPNPRRGYKVGTAIDYRYRSNRRVVTGDDPPTQITAVEFSSSEFLGITRRLVLAFGIRGWGIVNADGRVPIDEFRFIGGFESLRGYPEQFLPAFRYGIGTLEMRLLSGRKSRAYLFGDFGAINSSQSRSGDYDFRPGYGFGVLSPTTLGIFRVEISWSENRFPEEAVLNFGLAGDF